MAEQWRPVVGWEGFYEVSDDGQVRSVRRTVLRKNGRPMTVKERLLSQAIGSHGYPMVGLYADGQGEWKCVHAIVAEAFIGPRPAGHHVCHNDGTKHNNTVGNLRYATPAENRMDSVRHGTAVVGEKARNSKLTASDVAKIRGLRGTRTQADLSRMFGVGQDQISRIQTGERWAHVA